MTEASREYIQATTLGVNYPWKDRPEGRGDGTGRSARWIVPKIDNIVTYGQGIILTEAQSTGLHLADSTWDAPTLLNFEVHSCEFTWSGNRLYTTSLYHHISTFDAPTFFASSVG